MGHPENCRFIAILDPLAKALTSTMANWLQEWAPKNIPESQNGFRWHRGTGDSYWNLTQFIRTRKRKGLDTWVAFIDLKTAFDKVSREAIFELMFAWEVIV